MLVTLRRICHDNTFGNNLLSFFLAVLNKVVDYDAATVPECLVAEQPVGVAYAAALVQVQLILLLTALMHSALMLVV